MERVAPTEGCLLLQLEVPLAHLPSHALRVLQQPLLLVHGDGGQRGGAGQGVAVVGEPAGEGALLEHARDLRAHAHRAQLHVGGGDALGHGDEVGHHAPVLDREPAAGAAEAAHHLVADEQDAVAVADLAHALHVAVGRDQDAVGADHRLHDEGGDVGAALVADHVLDLGQGRRHRLGVLAPVLVEVGRAHHAGDARLGRPAPRVAGERDGPRGAAVVGAVAHQDLVASRSRRAPRGSRSPSPRRRRW